jgi:hypothetical protein
MRPSRSLLTIVAALAACATNPRIVTPVRIIDSSPTPDPRPFHIAGDNPFVLPARAEWPGPNRVRTASGAPGPDYWQQRADYTIAATLDTSAKSVNGSVTIRYTNNSPDTLRFVWMYLEQNLYRPGSHGSAIFPQDSRWGVRGFQGGFDLADVRVNGSSVVPRVDDTRMRLDLPEPLAARGGAATLTMRFSFRVPEHGSDRMARDSTLYLIAQWYPRMAVYDDAHGWNVEPYLGQGEFYLEYGDFDYTVTAPAGYVIAGSGALLNPGEVLTPERHMRLARATTSNIPSAIIPASEAVARPEPGTKTWRFRAENVRDVAWAGAPDFRWDATSANGVLTQAFYQWPKAGPQWESAAAFTQWTIRYYSERFSPYPYPQATSVAGTVGGMEYPMFVMVHYSDTDSTSVFRTIDHEHGHEWFPMTVGSNERRYAWMDEGFNTYINAFSFEAHYPGQSTWERTIQNWQAVVENHTQSPLMTMPDLIDPTALGAIGYRKPAAVLMTLRNQIVGRDVFDAAFREYIRRWAFKHPTPADFFRTIENATGTDLSWFWKGFFYSDDVLDIGVEYMHARAGEPGDTLTEITLRRNTSIVFPVTARLKLADGSLRELRLPVEIWARTDRYVTTVRTPRSVVGIRLWPDGTVPDFNAANDIWGDAPPAEPHRPVTADVGNGGRGTPR